MGGGKTFCVCFRSSLELGAWVRLRTVIILPGDASARVGRWERKRKKVKYIYISMYWGSLSGIGVWVLHFLSLRECQTRKGSPDVCGRGGNKKKGGGGFVYK